MTRSGGPWPNEAWQEFEILERRNERLSDEVEQFTRTSAEMSAEIRRLKEKIKEVFFFTPKVHNLECPDGCAFCILEDEVEKNE